MDKKEILWRLSEPHVDYSFSEVARLFKTTRQFVSQVVAGEHDSELAYAIRCFISHKIGVAYDDVWGISSPPLPVAACGVSVETDAAHKVAEPGKSQAVDNS